MDNKVTYKDIVLDIKSLGIDFDKFVRNSYSGELSWEERDKIKNANFKWFVELDVEEIEAEHPDYDCDSYRVNRFKNTDIYVEYTFWWVEGDGCDYDDSEVYEVEPVQVINIEYKRVK